MKNFIVFLLVLATCATEINAQVFRPTQDSTALKSKFTVKKSYLRNITYTGLVFAASGFIVKAQKKDFRTMRTYFKPHFKTTLDNYSQYSPLAAAFALKALGVQSESSWKRLTINSAASYVFMAAIVNGIKYTAKEIRPDNSTKNSFPSGHTATVFAGATIFQKEYGWRSPWYTVGAYSVATLTGVSRIMNNRHWISDVLVGAGIGIVSTDLGYFVGDIIQKGKGKKHADRKEVPDISHRPTFISMTIGTGYGPKYLNTPDINDSYDANNKAVGNPMNLRLKTGRSASFNVEGAYYLNDYIGVGGKLRVTTLPLAVESFNNNFGYVVPTNSSGSTNNDFSLLGLESNHLGMIDVSAGLYFSVPLGTRFRVGTNFLLGNRLTTSYSVDALFTLNKEGADYQKLYNILEKNIGSDNDWVNYSDGQISRDEIDQHTYHDHDFMKIKANNTMVYSTGLSFTYAYKKDVSLRAFAEYQHASPKYTYELNNRYDSNFQAITDQYEKRTEMNNFSGGVGVAVFF